MLPPSSSTHAFVSYHIGQICHNLHCDKISEIDFHFPIHEARSSSFHSHVWQLFRRHKQESGFLCGLPVFKGYSGGCPLRKLTTVSTTLRQCNPDREAPPSTTCTWSIAISSRPILGLPSCRFPSGNFIKTLHTSFVSVLSKLLDSLLSTRRKE
jgi:hypothetical protein